MPPTPLPEVNPNEGVDQTLEMLLEQQAQVASETLQNQELQLEAQTKMLDKMVPTRFSVEIGEGAEQVVIEGPQGEIGPMGPMPVKGVDYFTDADIAEIILKITESFRTYEQRD